MLNNWFKFYFIFYLFYSMLEYFFFFNKKYKLSLIKLFNSILFFFISFLIMRFVWIFNYIFLFVNLFSLIMGLNIRFRKYFIHLMLIIIFLLLFSVSFLILFIIFLLSLAFFYRKVLLFYFVLLISPITPITGNLFVVFYHYFRDDVTGCGPDNFSIDKYNLDEFSPSLNNKGEPSNLKSFLYFDDNIKNDPIYLNFFEYFVDRIILYFDYLKKKKLINSNIIKEFRIVFFLFLFKLSCKGYSSWVKLAMVFYIFLYFIETDIEDLKDLSFIDKDFVYVLNCLLNGVKLNTILSIFSNRDFPSGIYKFHLVLDGKTCSSFIIFVNSISKFCLDNPELLLSKFDNRKIAFSQIETWNVFPLEENFILISLYPKKLCFGHNRKRCYGIYFTLDFFFKYSLSSLNLSVYNEYRKMLQIIERLKSSFYKEMEISISLDYISSGGNFKITYREIKWKCFF